ncbi:Ferric siderophore transport system, periplasmic binding protein TonB [Lysobacter dokdonensis DS-58]|uniref:Protein TonB n=1 Tax=Lysobacter dokdonensis DS-58 TaxID=1300345 RepID=A0A0A2WR05_9GAMM|nr:energy transducer TonB [Lysobacter dokdonensis]KGQ20715.1 Ferric siderophore transport system, periplasmic binding protein TonB [Lysobacter dokdonensis DS-58]
MSHTIAPSLPARRAQAGHLAERPSPARITAFAGVISLHVAALMLLMMPMAPPEALPKEEVTVPIWLIPKRVEPVPPPPPTETRRIDPRPVQQPTPQPRVEQPPIVDPVGVDVAPPYDPNPDTAIVVETVQPPVGPMRSDSLEYASAPPPPYPREAMARRIEGTVVLEVLVDVDGTPLDVRVQTSSGNRALDDAARKHILKKWKFRPATQGGQAVQSIGLVPVKFVLR